MTHWITAGNERQKEDKKHGPESGSELSTSTETLKQQRKSPQDIVRPSGHQSSKIADPIDFPTLNTYMKLYDVLDELNREDDGVDERGAYFKEVEDFYSTQMAVLPDDFQPWDRDVKNTPMDDRLKHIWGNVFKYSLNALQIYSIPMILSGNGVVVQAPTGIGKTMAFLIPAVQKVIDIKKTAKPSSIPSPYVLILNNTGNLAQQTYERAERLCGKSTRDDFDVSEVSIDVYIAQPKIIKPRCDIAVATMGKLKSYIDEGKISLSQLKLLIVDEADKMTAFGGFGMQVEDFYDHLEESVRENLQSCFFSATYESNQMDVGNELIAKLLRYEIPHKIWIPSMPGHITQRVITIDTGDEYIFEYFKKLSVVKKLIDNDLKRTGCSKEGPYEETIAVFCETVGKVNMVASALQAAGYNFRPLNRTIEKPQQKINLKLLKLKKIQGVVATNIMARGIDVASIKHIIVMEMSSDFETYRHRIGRTGRAGHGGNATVLINPSHYSVREQHVMVAFYEFLRENHQKIPEFVKQMHEMRTREMREAL